MTNDVSDAQENVGICTFELSAKALTRYWKTSLISALVGYVFGAIYFSWPNLHDGLWILNAVFLTAFSTPFITAELAELPLKIIIYDDAIWHNTKHDQPKWLPYKKISKVSIHRNLLGKIVSIQIFAARRDKPVIVRYYENMEEIFSAIQPQLSGNIEVHRALFFPPVPAVMAIAYAVFSVVFRNYFPVTTLDSWKSIFALAICVGSLRSFPFLKKRARIPVFSVLLLLAVLPVVRLFRESEFYEHPCGIVQKYLNQGSCVRWFEDSTTKPAFMPASDTLVTANYNFIQVYSPPIWHWKNLKALRHRGNVDGFVISKNGETLVSWVNETWYKWDLNARKRIAQYSFEDYCYINEVSIDGRFFVCGILKGSTTLWDAQLWRPVTEIDSDLRRPVFSEDGNLLAAINESNDIELWNLTDMARIGVIPMSQDEEIDSLTISPNNRVIATVLWRARAVELWDIHDKSLIESLIVSDNVWLFGLEFSPDGKYLVARASNWDSNEDSAIIYIWELSSGNLQPIVLPDTDANWLSTSFSQESSLFAIGFRRNLPEQEAFGSYVHVWKIDGNEWELSEELYIGKEFSDKIETLDFSSDETLLAVGTGNATYVFDVSQ